MRKRLSVDLGINHDTWLALAKKLNTRPATLAAHVLKFFLEQNKATDKEFTLVPVKAKRGLYLRLNDEELECIELLAAKLKKNRQQAIIALIESVITSKPLVNEDAERELRESNYQLSRIGINLNQITRFFNSLDKNISDANLKFHLSLIYKEHVKLTKAIKIHTAKVWKIINSEKY